MNILPIDKRFKSVSLDARPVLDMAMAAFETIAPGNIRVTGTWFMDPETRTSQPCLVLTDARRPLTRNKASRRAIPCIITLDVAWKWTVEMGDPTHVWATISDWLREGVLPGSPTNNHDKWAVFNAVQCRLRDMMMMKPMPAAPAIKYGTPPEVVGEVVITDQRTGAVLQEVELTKHVRH